MKKTLLALVMGIIMIGFVSCGNSNGKSKAFNKSMKIVDDVMESIEKASTCEDIDNAYGDLIMRLIFVDDFENMPQDEQDELNNRVEEMNKISESKKAELDCPDLFDFEDDDEVPMDEEIEME